MINTVPPTGTTPRIKESAGADPTGIFRGRILKWLSAQSK